MKSAAVCSSVDRNHQPHTANAEEEGKDMRMLQDPPSTTNDEENDMAPWIKVTSPAIRRKTRASLATRLVLQPKPRPLPADDKEMAIRPRNGLGMSNLRPMAKVENSLCPARGPLIKIFYSPVPVPIS
ncbi:hypothetical protein HPB47_020714 [Ixodes persulcatus]|uniref:Uncharacterized protein n=1 Tax=Ixodes persulcatus TaxID=34615 RepID=A0AC60QEM3_IXOPE|nr:hypothetical protein HPB47_020714 [Ixodes persulcatus]